MALPLPRIIPDKDVQANFDELANQFPIQAANIAPNQVKASALGALVIPVTAATSYTFSNLNGNTDYGYDIHIHGAVATGAGVDPAIEPNAVSTGMTRVKHYVNQAATHGADSAASTGAATGIFFATPYTINANVTFAAKTGVGSYRSIFSNGITIRDSDAAFYSSQHFTTWSDVSTNVTSIKVTFGAAFTGTIFLRKHGS